MSARVVCTALAHELARAINRWDNPANRGFGRDDARTGVVGGAVLIFSSVSATDQLDRFLTAALADKSRYDLRTVLIPDVKTVYKSLPRVPEAATTAARILNHCLEELRAADRPAGRTADRLGP